MSFKDTFKKFEEKVEKFGRKIDHYLDQGIEFVEKAQLVIDGTPLAPLSKWVSIALTAMKMVEAVTPELDDELGAKITSEAKLLMATETVQRVTAIAGKPLKEQDVKQLIQFVYDLAKKAA